MALLDINKRYSPGELAGYAGGVGETWNGKEFFYGGEKYVIRDNGDGSRSVQQLNPTGNDIRSGKAFGGNSSQILKQEIANAIIELEDKLAKIPNVTFTSEELEAFANKALDEITPYYEKKKLEIEKGIKEGKIRTAEDTLNLIRNVQEEVRIGFAKYDIEQAQTEEEFINKLADITSSSEEAFTEKQFEWKQRIEEAKLNLGRKGILSSGIGQKTLSELDAKKQQEFEALQRRTEQAKTDTTVAKKFSLDRIALARQSITDERKRRIGEPTDTQALVQKARTELGLGEGQDIGSEADIAYARDQRNTKVYDPTALDSIKEERRKALEVTKLDIQRNEEDKRTQEYEAQRRAIQSEIAKKQAQLSSY